MKYVGYHRTSTREQNLDRGIRAIEDFAKQKGIKLKKIYVDQATGKNFDRPQYRIMRDEVLDEGDVLIISELDRLGRNKSDTLKELKYFKDYGIRVMILELPTTLMDIGDYKDELSCIVMEIITNLMIEFLAAQAETELMKMKKRQREGLDTLREKGEWYKLGRPRVMKQADFDREYQKVLNGEVARFARNTEEALKFVKELRTIGVEIYFVNDDIWTFNEDSDLRLTIMAGVAQEEARKDSERVKAGIFIARQKGILWGNGNRFGYKRVGKTFELEPEQYETCRMIGRWYEQGYGMKKIKNLLEINNRPNGTGEKVWDISAIQRILSDPFYAGIGRIMDKQKGRCCKGI